MSADCAPRLLPSLTASRESIRELINIKAHAVNSVWICKLWSVEHYASAVSYSLHWLGVAYTGGELQARWLALTAIKGREPADKVMLLWRKGLSMTSSQSIAMTTVFGLGMAFVSAAWADPASDACAALVDARSALYSMLNAKDKSAQDALNTKVQAASTKLDSVLAGMTGADAKVAADFKAVWDQFKATREEELIPAIHKGNADDAKKIANGIQHDRLSKMWGIMSCK